MRAASLATLARLVYGMLKWGHEVQFDKGLRYLLHREDVDGERRAGVPRRKSSHPNPPRVPAGPSPVPRSTLRTVVADKRIPSALSSPTIR